MADINLHSTPTIIFVEDCYLPQSVKMVEETLGMWDDTGSEVFGLVFDTFARIARVEASDN